MSNLAFAVLAALLFFLLASAILWYWRRSRRAAADSFDSILARLSPLDRHAIAAVALDAITEPITQSGQPLPGSDHPASDCTGLDPALIYHLVGGLEGLELIRHNCRVLVELAAYVQRWYPEAVAVAERLRLAANEIEWHVDRLLSAARTGNLESSFADYAQPAVATYFLMTRNLLELYHRAGFNRVATLQAAL